MLENIALIKEVHQRLSVKKAEQEAYEMLQKIQLEAIADKRVSQCSAQEIFYVMFIRALMMEERRVFLLVPVTITETLKDIQSIIKGMNRLNDNKSVEILDVSSNELYYKGCACSIVK